ncbi:MAG: hypothetical protein GOU99_02525 [Candidatus Altiarchaeota archaeon]|nr:hypothetical protein [Candidatus Altiarchaeota archaeon]
MLKLENTLKLILRFSYKPNILGLCGRREDEIYKLVTKSGWSAGETERAIDFVKDLKALYAYLNSIADACNKKPLDPEVVNACLIGWNKWEDYGKKAVDFLKGYLKPIALSKKTELIEQLPDYVPLTHNFHTLYFGAIVLDIPKLVSFSDMCKVSQGKIVKNGVAEYNRLLPGLKLDKARLKIESPFLDISLGDEVFIHHRIVFKKANQKEKKLYNNDLQKVIEYTAKSW